LFVSATVPQSRRWGCELDHIGSSAPRLRKFVFQTANVAVRLRRNLRIVRYGAGGRFVSRRAFNGMACTTTACSATRLSVPTRPVSSVEARRLCGNGGSGEELTSIGSAIALRETILSQVNEAIRQARQVA